MSELKDLTKRQLIERADALGIPLHSSTSHGDMVKLLAKVEALGRTTVVDVVDEYEEEEAVTTAPRKVKKDLGPAPGKIRITIAKDSQDKRQRPVFLGHNNVGYLVPRGKPVDIPANVIFSLADAKEVIPIWDDELETATGRGGYTLEERNSYPYQILAFGESTPRSGNKPGIDMESIQQTLGY